ncbi:MAG: hypothetical protein LUQ22_01075 [Methanotrichaceae archaeon]|nr:hypothetical protein [Methanotrichaceae archaeon]
MPVSFRDKEHSQVLCKKKVCCIKILEIERTCSNCSEYLSCSMLKNFYGKKGYKYKSIGNRRSSIEVMVTNPFCKSQRNERPYGKLTDCD